MFENVNPNSWNKKTNRAKESKNIKEYPEFNNRLNNIESSIRNVFRRYQNDNNRQMPLPETLKQLLDVEIRKTQPVKQKNRQRFLNIWKSLLRVQRKVLA